jgi:predicted transcriptional regulator
VKRPPRDVVLTVRVSAADAAALTRAADAIDRPRSYVVRHALADLIAAHTTPAEGDDGGTPPLPFG